VERDTGLVKLQRLPMCSGQNFSVAVRVSGCIAISLNSCIGWRVSMAAITCNPLSHLGGIKLISSRGKYTKSFESVTVQSLKLYDHFLASIRSDLQTNTTTRRINSLPRSQRTIINTCESHSVQPYIRDVALITSRVGNCRC
jgi:hypothetical protein